jgi:hypothetical protein
VDGAQMPREDQLPTVLKELSQRQAVRLAHERFGADADGLAAAIRKAIGPSVSPPELTPEILAEKRKSDGWPPGPRMAQPVSAAVGPSPYTTAGRHGEFTAEDAVKIEAIFAQFPGPVAIHASSVRARKLMLLAASAASGMGLIALNTNVDALRFICGIMFGSGIVYCLAWLYTLVIRRGRVVILDGDGVQILYVGTYVGQGQRFRWRDLRSFRYSPFGIIKFERATKGWFGGVKWESESFYSCHELTGKSLAWVLQEWRGRATGLS